MFAHRGIFFKALLGSVALVAAFVALGCGSEGGSQTITLEETPSAEAPPSDGDGPSGVEPDVEDADSEDVEVITAWADALGEGDVEAAAEYFALPSVAENGPLVTRIKNAEDAVDFNESLPCGAEVISAETTGTFTTATFRLYERPGGGCGPGVDGTASTSFVIEDGKIAEWRRVGTDAEPEGPAQSTT